ncbi:cell wall integrity and stress response component [Microdochium nivale]|nr:cell wall integrity and stress response component [Microdochium nivale]
MTNDLCPNDPALLQSCVCTKNQNSLRVSQDINASVKYSCDPITADISVAQGVFAGYCGLGAGTTSFPTFAPPPGDMTYYITALPQYDSLVPCAQSGLSRGVMSATNELCPKDPAGLASCVCFKTGMPNWVSKVITSSVKYACSSTASQDLSSALAVWDYFCSAARAEVKPSVTESVPTTAFTNNLNGVGGQPTQTGTTNSGGGLNGGGGPSGTGGGDSENKPNIGMIVGGVVGGIAVIVLVGVAIFLLMRRRKAAQNGNSGDSEMVQDSFPPATATAVPSGGKSELDSIAVAGKPGATGGSGNGVSPVSAAHTPELKNHGPFAPPPPMPEMPAQYANSPQQPRQNELHGQDYRPELYGQQAYRPELQGQTGYSASAAVSPQSPAGANGLGGQQVHEAPGPYPNRSPQEMQGHAWMPPTQPQYYEMPGGGAASYGGR